MPSPALPARPVPAWSAGRRPSPLPTARPRLCWERRCKPGARAWAHCAGCRLHVFAWVLPRCLSAECCSNPTSGPGPSRRRVVPGRNAVHIGWRRLSVCRTKGSAQHSPHGSGARLHMCWPPGHVLLVSPSCALHPRFAMLQRATQLRFSIQLEDLPVSPACRDLLGRIFVLDPHQRLSLVEVLEHPWCAVGMPPALQVKH